MYWKPKHHEEFDAHSKIPSYKKVPVPENTKNLVIDSPVVEMTLIERVLWNLKREPHAAIGYYSLGITDSRNESLTKPVSLYYRYPVNPFRKGKWQAFDANVSRIRLKRRSVSGLRCSNISDVSFVDATTMHRAEIAFRHNSRASKLEMSSAEKNVFMFYDYNTGHLNKLMRFLKGSNWE